MAPDKPPKNATIDQMMEWLYKDHLCRDRQHTEAMVVAEAAQKAVKEVAEARDHIASKLTLDRNVSIIGLIMLIISVLGSYAYAINTLRDIQEGQSKLVAAGHGRDGRLNTLDTNVATLSQKIGVLCDIAVSNREALIGPDRSGRNCR